MRVVGGLRDRIIRIITAGLGMEATAVVTPAARTVAMVVATPAVGVVEATVGIDDRGRKASANLDFFA